MNLEITYLILFAIILNTLILGYNIINKQPLNSLFCGIIGFSSKKQCNTDKIALLMLHNSLKRGEDNTGTYCLEDGVNKTALSATDYLQKYELPKTHLFIGHVRKASVGSKVEANAHPFEFDNIVLVHNGTLNNHISMCKDAGYEWKDFDTDTQVLAKLMDDDSKKENKLFTTLSEYKGFAALLFTDKRTPDVLYAYRNTDRPLFYGSLEGSMYISSLEESLRIIDCKDVKEFPSHYLHTIKHGKLVSSIYYKEKQETTTYHNRSNVSAVHYKNDEALTDFVARIRSTDKMLNKQLVDRWGQSEVTRYNTNYGENNLVNITKGNWYYIEDNSASNDYDIQFTDDKDRLVWENKFTLDFKYADYPNGYCKSVVNIFRKDDVSKMLFPKDSIIKIAPRALISEDNFLSCIFEDEIIDIDLKLIRPVLTDEINAYLEKNVEKINKELAKNQSSLNFHQAMNPNGQGQQLAVSPAVLPGIESFLKVVKKEEKIEDAVIITSEQSDESPFLNEGETEILPNDGVDEAEEILTYTLDVIDNAFDEVDDLVQTTNWDELKVATAQLKEVINEAYNIDGIRQILAEDPKV